jgi:alanine racemase
MSHEQAPRRAAAHINLAAIERNCARLRSRLSGQGRLCAVVKADGYGHGIIQAARAAINGGASWLAVACAQEATELRRAGLREVPVLVMGALTDLELSEALAAEADVVVWHQRYLEKVAKAGGGRVHIKLDSGMGRLGTRDPQEASQIIDAALERPSISVVGIMTHFATADDTDDAFFAAQLSIFDRWVGEVRARHPAVISHAANSAALLREDASHFDMVRCGIAIYGMDPFGKDAASHGLQAALELSSYVAEVKALRAGESVGYGRTFVAAEDTHIGVLPIGYGDGWRRALSNNSDVLIASRRYPVVGTISMDNLTVDLGGDEAATQLCQAPAMLIGASGSQRISAEDVARTLHTINYEITCGLSRRVMRVYHRDGERQHD